MLFFFSILGSWCWGEEGYFAGGDEKIWPVQGSIWRRWGWRWWLWLSWILPANEGLPLQRRSTLRGKGWGIRLIPHVRWALNRNVVTCWCNGIRLDSRWCALNGIPCCYTCLSVWWWALNRKIIWWYSPSSFVMPRLWLPWFALPQFRVHAFCCWWLLQHGRICWEGHGQRWLCCRWIRCIQIPRVSWLNK